MIRGKKKSYSKIFDELDEIEKHLTKLKEIRAERKKLNASCMKQNIKDEKNEQ